MTAYWTLVQWARPRFDLGARLKPRLSCRPDDHRIVSILRRRGGFLRALGAGVGIGFIGNDQPGDSFLKVMKATGVPSVVCCRCHEKLCTRSWPAAMEYSDAVAIPEAGIVEDGYQ